jgi:hypothetical protein
VLALWDGSVFASPEAVLGRINAVLRESPVRLPQGEELGLGISVGAHRYIPTVRFLAEERGQPALALWIDTNPQEYGRGAALRLSGRLITIYNRPALG